MTKLTFALLSILSTGIIAGLLFTWCNAVMPGIKKLCGIAFSPGEHFGMEFQLKQVIEKLRIPVFVTSSKEEAPKVTDLITCVKSKVQFIPIEKGTHGSITLWSYTPNNQEYWNALLGFLKATIFYPK